LELCNTPSYPLVSYILEVTGAIRVILSGFAVPIGTTNLENMGLIDPITSDIRPH